MIESPKQARHGRVGARRRGGVFNWKRALVHTLL